MNIFLTINQLVVGSIPTAGAKIQLRNKGSGFYAQESFESELSKIDIILRGQPSPEAGREYASSAETYIRAMQSVTRSLPDTSAQIADYIDAIAALRRYYDLPAAPKPGTEEWMLFYGQFRVDYNNYVQTREAYFNVLASELGDYARYVTNS